MLEISKKHKVILFTLLLILNIVLRIPSIPHEKGGDSFFIHSLANSITASGKAGWWVNWLSVFGLYPYSYASAIPFSLSGTAQLTGLTGLAMEKNILLYSIMLGVFSIFTAYTLAGVIYRDFLFKYLMALFFSAAQGTMVFSTWEISTRGPFIIFLPLFIFILLKKMGYARKTILLPVLGIFLYATHHYAYFLIPLTLLYIVLKILSIFRLSSEKKRYLNYMYLMGVGAAFALPFFTRALITAGSRYAWVQELIIVNTRYVGPIILFVVGGLIYTALKQDKKIEEWYFLGAFLLFAPFSYNLTYGQFILVLFLIFLIAISFRNLLSIKTNRLLLFMVIINILLFVSFSAFYNHERTGRSKSYWYMKEATYKAAEWTKYYIPDNKTGFGNGGETWRLFATSDAHPVIPTGGAAVIAYGLINESDIKAVRVSPTSSDYYFEGPYVRQRGTSIGGLINWFLELKDIDDERAGGIIKRFNMTYFTEDVHVFKPLVPSIHRKKSNIYDNGRLRIWLL